MPTIRFIGDKSWQELHDPGFTTDSWGLDHARWSWSGAVDLALQHETSLQRFQTLPGFAYMRLQSWTKEDHRSFPKIERHYVGLRTGQPPPVKAEDSTVSQQAQVTATPQGGGGKVSGVFTYRASRTTYRWLETSNPATTSRYTSVRRAKNPLQTIESFAASDSTGTTKQIAYSEFVALLNALRVEMVVTNYTIEDVIPNVLWACTAEVDYRFAST